MSAKQMQLTVPIEKVSMKDLSFTPFESNDRSRGQQISYPRYNHPKLNKETAFLAQLQFSKVLKGAGFVRPNPDYYPDDKSRSFIKYTKNDDGGQDTTFSKMEELDKFLGSDEFKKANFGKTWKKYKYVPIVRVPENEDEEKEPYPPYMKLKLELSYPDSFIQTQMYKSEMVNNKRVRTRYLPDVSEMTLSQAEEFITYQSKIRPIIRLVKLWASKKKEYGAVFKLPKIEVEPSVQKKSMISDWYKSDGFLDSDSEDEDIVQATAAKEEEEEGTTESENDLDSDLESDDESESEEVVVKKSKSKNK